MEVTDGLKPITAQEMIWRIMRSQFPRNFVLPNYTPAGWWECDVFEITEAGYFREYEVKVSRSDFFADRRKKREDSWKMANTESGWQRVTIPGAKKFDRIDAADPVGPSRFWYVTPAGLVRPNELPRWAGLIEFTRHDKYSYLSMKEIMPAKWIHREPCKPAVKERARITAYYRHVEKLLCGNGSDHEDHEWVI